MNAILDGEAHWIGFAIAALLATLAATLYSFWRKRNMDRSGPRKGVAANPEKVRNQNSQTGNS